MGKPRRLIEREKRVEAHTFGLGRGGRNRHGSGDAVRGDSGAVSEARYGGPVVALPAASALP